MEFTHRTPRFVDNNQIVYDAITAMNQSVDDWDGVQFSKQFIDEFSKTGKYMTYPKFLSVARNHQDQTSWTISGNRFFAPYMARTRQVWIKSIPFP